MENDYNRNPVKPNFVAFRVENPQYINHKNVKLFNTETTENDMHFCLVTQNAFNHIQSDKRH